MMSDIGKDNYRNWNLRDYIGREEAWPASMYPDAGNRYFHDCGCAVASLAIMLRKYDIENETDPDKFNPWILNRRLISCRAFGRSADLYFSQIRNLYPLEYMGKITYSREKLIEVYESGEPFLIMVMSDTPRHHFVVPDILTDDDLSVIDCSKTPKKYLSEFSEVLEIRRFRIVDGPCFPQPAVALSFDDGPSRNGVSGRIVDTLLKYDVKATFFEIGENVADRPDDIRRKAELGFEIGTHSWDHETYGDELTTENMLKGYQAVVDALGTPPSCFRSPGGFVCPHIDRFCIEHKLPSYNWSIDTLDWKYKDADYIYDAVMSNVKNGDIILIHELYNTSADALERIIPALLDEGFKLVTCGDLIRLKTGKEPEPGVTYLSSFGKVNTAPGC